jgi:hypothetical protein
LLARAVVLPRVDFDAHPLGDRERASKERFAELGVLVDVL